MEHEVYVEALGADDSAALAAARELLESAFGPGGFPLERLRSFADAPDARMACARIDGAVVGVAIARLEVDLARPFGHFGAGALERIRGPGVGVLESGAVAEAWRGRGVARAMALWLLDWLRAHGCRRAVSASWASGREQSSRPVLERLGFRAVADSDGESYRVRNLGGRPCPVCGVPCRCSGTLFVLELA